jgi:hypothetical protein
MPPAKKETLVYIKHPTLAWIPARLDKQEGDKAYVSVPQYADEQSIGRVPAKKFVEQVVNLKDYPHQVLPLQNVDSNGGPIVYPDMVTLAYLHEVNLPERVASLMSSSEQALTFCLLFFYRLLFCTTLSTATRQETRTRVPATLSLL